MNDSEIFLLQELRETLKHALVRSWNAAIELHPTESIYGYTIFTSPTISYLVPSYNSEESLARMAVNHTHYLYLQWSPDEWEYYLENKAFFEPVNNILNYLEVTTDFHTAEAFGRRWHTVVDTLLELDREKLFGEEEKRNRLTVNIMWGDQDAIAHLNSARKLNPTESYLRFAHSQLELFRDVREQILAIESLIKEAALLDIDITIERIIENIDDCY